MSWKTNIGIFLAATSGVANFSLSYCKLKQLNVIIEGQHATPIAILIREHAEAMSRFNKSKEIKTIPLGFF